MYSIIVDIIHICTKILEVGIDGHYLGFGEKVEDGDWSDVTTGEVGSMVREAIKRGEQAIVDEAKPEQVKEIARSRNFGLSL